MFNPGRMRLDSFHDEMMLTLTHQPMQQIDSSVSKGVGFVLDLKLSFFSYFNMVSFPAEPAPVSGNKAFWIGLDITEYSKRARSWSSTLQRLSPIDWFQIGGNFL
jgi:hypothetical protein